MMKCWSFYNPQTGEFTGRKFLGPDRALEANTPAGTVAKEGNYDRKRQRVNTETGEICELAVGGFICEGVN